MTPTCPHCNSPHRQPKWGLTACGSQKHRCQGRKLTYTPDPKKNGYPTDLRRQAILMSVDGLNLRRIAPLLSVNHQSVANWLKAYHTRLPAQHPQTPQPAQAETVELDELYTFVGWCVVEEHDWDALQGMVDRAPAASHYFSDGFDVCPTLLCAPGVHAVAPGESQTYSVEGGNADLRHSLARLGRGSRRFSRCIEALRRAVLFVHCYNERPLWRRAHPNSKADMIAFLPQLT